jgi:CBS domain-containing protein
MTAHPRCCTTTDDLRSTALQMRDGDIGLLPVVDSLLEKHLIGVISDRDIICRVIAGNLDPTSATVGDAMTSGFLWTAHPDDPIERVLDEMEDGQVRRIPVVDDGGIVVGIVATADIATDVDNVEEVAEVFEEISVPRHFPHG